MSEANQSQVGGDHYQQEIQTWDFIYRNKIPYLEGNIIKYVVRYRRKHGVTDLQKARHYLDKLIEEVALENTIMGIPAAVSPLSESIVGGPTSGYVNQD